MRRLTLAAVAAAAVLALSAPPAGAKGIAELTACGVGGCHDATPKGHDVGVLEGGPQIAAPERQAPFFRLRATIGVPDMPEGDPIEILYVPSLHVMRVLGTDRVARWMAPTTSGEAALRRATAGLVAFEASSLMLTGTGPVTRARVVEVVPAPSPDGDDASGSSWLPWAGATLAVLALVAGPWLALTRRRRARPGLHPTG